MKAIIDNNKEVSVKSPSIDEKQSLNTNIASNMQTPFPIPESLTSSLNCLIQRKIKMLNINDFHKIETSDGTIWYHNLQTDIPINQIISFNFYKLRGQYFKTYPAEIASFNSSPINQNPIDYTKTPKPIPNHNPLKGVGETEIWLHEPPENAWYAYVIYYMTI